MSDAPTLCLNCETPLQGDFCHVCGQKGAVGRLHVKELVQLMSAQLFNTEATVWQTIIGLTRNPGKVCISYIQGQRVRYVQPFRYFVISLAFLLLVSALIRSSPVTSNVGEGEQAARVAAIAIPFLNKYLNWVILAVLPLYALYLRILFWKGMRNFAEIMVFVLFVVGHNFLLGIFFLPLSLIEQGLHNPVKIAFLLLFLSWSIRTFFEAAVLKSLFAAMGYFAILIFGISIILTPLLIPVLRGS